MGAAMAQDRGSPGGDELTLAGLAVLGVGTACDAEPIHLSGAIQPHGFLLGVDPVTSAVLVVSANLADHLGVDPGLALGARLRDLLGEAATRRINPLLGSEIVSAADPLIVHVPVGPAGEVGFEVVGHRSGPLVLVEFEHSSEDVAGLTTFHHALREALDPALASADVATACLGAAERIRDLTGFDRVLVYQFSDDGHGSVVAEAVAADSDAESLLGMHYPAVRHPPPGPRALPPQAGAADRRRRVRPGRAAGRRWQR